MFSPLPRFLLAFAFLTVSFGYLGMTPKAMASATPDTWLPPVASQNFVNDFWSPNGDYAAGHRGIDYPSFEGEPVFSVAYGVVRFAGQVAGRGVMSLTLNNGLVAEVEPVCPLLTKGENVLAGQQIATFCDSTPSHCNEPCLHLSARRFSTEYARGFAYLTPLLFLGNFRPSHLVSIGSMG